MFKHDGHSEAIQDMLDEGLSIAKIAGTLGLYRNDVLRVINRNKLEIYEPYDEVSEAKQETLTEWDYEDLIDDWLREVYYNGNFLLPKTTEEPGLYRHIKENYSGIRQLLERRARHMMMNSFYIECSKCTNRLPLNKFSNQCSKISGLSPTCRKCSYEGKSKMALLSSDARRRAYRRELPNTWGKNEYGITSSLYGDKCTLSNEGQTEFDHFIPLSIGHSGTVTENMYPLSKGLNRNKSDANPFEWFAANAKRFNLDPSRFESLVAKLAEQNGLTPEDFREYTYWCFDNPRDLMQIKRDNARYGYRVTSVELWSEATGRSSETGNRLNSVI